MRHLLAMPLNGTTVAVLAIVPALASVSTVALWVRRRLVLVTVNGSSMEPTLLPGDRVLVRRRPLSRVRRGDVVVIEPPGTSVGGWHIKRVLALPGDPVPAGIPTPVGVRRVPPDALVVLGDGAISSDSRQQGFFAATDLLGVMVRFWSRPKRHEQEGAGDGLPRPLLP